MTLISKAAKTMIVSTMILILILYGISNRVIFQKFLVLENKIVNENVNRVKGAMNRDISNISIFANDWGAWDETCRFVDDLNEYYIVNNLVDELFINYKINFMIFVNNKGEIVYSKYFDLIKRKESDRNREFEKYISSIEELTQGGTITDQKSGVIMFSNNSILIASAPIINSSFTGPINGKLIVGKYFNEQTAKDVSKTTALNVTFDLFKNPNKADDFKQAKSFFDNNDENFIYKLSEKNIAGYLLVKDIKGEPALILKIDMNRDLYKESKAVRIYFFMLIILVFIIFTAAILWILNYVVLLPSIQQETLLNTIPAIVSFKDDRLNYITVNKMFIEKMKLSYKSIKGKNVYSIFTKKEAEKICREDKEVMQSGIPILNSIRSFTEPDGDVKWLSVSKSPYFDKSKNIKGIVTICTDITEQKQMEEKFYRAAYFDQLTNLPNRLFFIKSMQDFIIDAKANSKSMALLYLDFDRFKLINDTEGHEAGDKFLKYIGEKMVSMLSGNMMLARLGGDEFGILVTNIRDEEEVSKICSDIQKLTNETWVFNTRVFHITASFGIAIYPKHGEDAVELLKNADAAMYYAKERGKNNYEFYNTSLSSSALKQVSMENSILCAINKDEFELYYQPQFNIITRKIVGVEALIRWNKPEYGIVSPQKFIPFAEQNGLITLIDKWVFKTACLQSGYWQNLNIRATRVAINISSKQLEDPNFVQYVKELLSETKADPSWLEVEITESALMKSPEEAVKILNALKAMGIKIALDDFGTGYSSLAYLKRFPIDKLKIDKTFIKDITENVESANIVKTIIDLSKSMGLIVVAEGVETEEQLEILKQQNCDEVQGYLFSKPVDVREVEEKFLRII